VQVAVDSAGDLFGGARVEEAGVAAVAGGAEHDHGGPVSVGEGGDATSDVAVVAGYLDTLEALLADTDSPVRLDDAGGLHLSPLAAEDHDPALAAERDALVVRIPTVPLTEILIDVDRDTNFTAALTHAWGATPRLPGIEHRRNLYAAILAQACNYGTARMAELTGIGADVIDWATRWHLREDTLRAANTAIVNAHHRHPLAAAWGGRMLDRSRTSTGKASAGRSDTEVDFLRPG